MPITHLVLGGGAHNGLNILGALFQLKKKKFFELKHINRIYSTSAGSVVAVLLLLNMEDETIVNYIVKRPWHKVIRLSPDIFINMLWDKGLLDKTFFNVLFSNLFATKDMTTSITLLEFYNITHVTLNICATKIGGMSPIIFSHETTPNLSLIDAVYMSSSMPIIFKPLFFEGDYIIDGGIIINNPIQLCLDCGANMDEILNIEIIRKVNALPEQNLNIFSYSCALFDNLLKKCNIRPTMNVKYTVIIPLDSLSVTEAKLALADENMRKQLIENGRQCADQFITYNSTELHE
tara:strand:+ start:646 stop:1521 length:876 start_codon:yes stop_codon:yes gene_type:complete